MLIDIIRPMVQGTEKEAWLVRGKQLNPYQKKVVTDKGLTIYKFTKLLFNEEDHIMVDVIRLCNIIGIPVEKVAAAIQ